MRNATELVASLGFGDFDANGYTDAFKTGPGLNEWSASYSGTNAWTTLNTNKPELLPQLLLGMRDRG